MHRKLESVRISRWKHDNQSNTLHFERVSGAISATADDSAAFSQEYRRFRDAPALIRGGEFAWVSVPRAQIPFGFLLATLAVLLS
jgi:hypothetical protein